MREHGNIVIFRRNPRLNGVLFVLLTLVFCLSANADWVWVGELGWVDMGKQPADSDQGLYVYASGLFVHGDYAAAADVFGKVEARFPDSAFAGKAGFGRARSIAKLGRLTEAGAICIRMIGEKTPEVDPAEMAAFALDEAKQLMRREPTFAAELAHAATSVAPNAQLHFQSLLCEGEIANFRGDYATARSFFEQARAVAFDQDSRDTSDFALALNDLISSRDGGNDAASLARAEERFKLLAGTSANAERAGLAQEYLNLLGYLKSEKDAGRREVYYTVTRLLEPGGNEGAGALKGAARKYRGSVAGEVARFYAAEFSYRARDLWQAFKGFEQFLNEYAGSTRRRAAVEREFEIGQALAEQGSHGRAETVMEAVARNSSGASPADDALMFIGRAELESERFDDARASFELVMQGYPKSKWNRAALFQCGVADLKHSNFAPESEMLLERARSAFEVYLKDEPTGTFSEQARALLRECRTKQARLLMDVARFYERRKEPKSAATYYQAVLEEQPESGVSADAKAALSRYDQIQKATPAHE